MKRSLSNIVYILQYAKFREWLYSFLEGFPLEETYNLK